MNHIPEEAAQKNLIGPKAIWTNAESTSIWLESAR